jgi:hypothetical protein
VTVELPPLASPVDELWHLLLDMGDALTIPWTLVGGQMVLLHAVENGQVPAQVSQDGDVIADIRADRTAITTIVRWLEAAGFLLDGMSPQLLAHRYVRPGAAAVRPVTFDVLAPDGLGERADLRTTPPGRTVRVPGGTQALDRTERIRVVHEGRSGLIPRPSLLAAIVAKAAALELPGSPDRHYRDLVLLLCLVPDPFAMRDQLTGKDRRRIRAAARLLDDSDVAWTLAPAELRSDGHTALQVLTAP